MKLLITGGGGPATESLWKLWNKKFDLFFADQDITKIHPSVPRNKCIEVPNAQSNDFSIKIERALNLYAIEIVISQVDEELVQLKYLEKLHPNLMIVSPEIEFLNLCLNKEKLGRSLESNNLSDPRTKKLDETSIYPGIETIFKPIFGRGSRDIFRVRNSIEFARIKDYLLVQEQEFIYQDLILGDEYTVQMICSRSGALNAIVPLIVNEKRGSTTNCKVSNNESVIDMCKKIHETYKPAGTYNIQLIYSNTLKKPFVIEINPRVSTTMCLALNLGFDPVEIYSMKEHTSEVKIPTENITLRRYWVNEFTNC